MKQAHSSITLFLVLAAGTCLAQEQDKLSRILDRVVAGEQELAAQMAKYRPFLETYIQELDAASLQPTADHYMLVRVDLTNPSDLTEIVMSAKFQAPPPQKRKWFLGGRRTPPPAFTFLPAGWAQMTFPDAGEFDRATYDFEYSRREFLGDVRCLVFDVAPKDRTAAGKFIGTIWADERDFRIVRFNGTYTNSRPESMFFHFDSWRTNVAPGVWAPAFVYVEEADPSGKPLDHPSLKAQTRIWGYNAQRSSKLDELADIQVEAAAPLEDKSGSKDVSPLESQRIWEKQAEQNVIQRLEKSGLISPAGELDEVLNTVISNLVVTNKISLDVKCRILMTSPFETFSLGQTVVISRGLLDVLPDEASLAMVLAEELANIALGHRTATSYAFRDQTMGSDAELLRRLHLARTNEEMEAAARKALEMLANSPYQDKLGNAGLFLQALGDRSPRLPLLVRANLGNNFASGDNLARLIELAKKAPRLEQNKVEQIAALPLGSRAKVDPWTNRITMIKTGPVTLLSAREKMPFEVTPVILHLTRAAAQESPKQ